MTDEDVSITYENNIFYCTKDNTKWISVDGENWYGEEERIKELEKENAELKHNKKTVAHLADCLEEKMKERIEELEQQIDKMRNCGNCKYGHCGGSSISIDKDGNRTFHNWNEEKEEYCDIGYQGKYQCWQLKE